MYPQQVHLLLYHNKRDDDYVNPLNPSILPSTNLSTAKTATVKNREPHQTIITNTAESTKQPCQDAAIQEEAPFFRISVTPMIQHSPSSINSQRQHKTLTAGRSILHNSLLLFVYYFCSTTTSTVSYATGGCRYFALITTHLVHLHRFGHHAIGRCIKKSITGIHQPP
jgi:hypothetical protein